MRQRSLDRGVQAVHEQGIEPVLASGQSVASLFDDGVIERWAKLFASRFRMPARADELTSVIVGAIAKAPLLSAQPITSDADLEELFHYARTSVEAHVGTSVFAVAGSVRATHAAVRALVSLRQQEPLGEQQVA